MGSPKSQDENDFQTCLVGCTAVLELLPLFQTVNTKYIQAGTFNEYKKGSAQQRSRLESSKSFKLTSDIVSLLHALLSVTALSVLAALFYIGYDLKSLCLLAR